MSMDEAMELVGQYVKVEFGAEVDAPDPVEQTPPKAKPRPLVFGRRSSTGKAAADPEEPLEPEHAQRNSIGGTASGAGRRLSCGGNGPT